MKIKIYLVLTVLGLLALVLKAQQVNMGGNSIAVPFGTGANLPTMSLTNRMFASNPDMTKSEQTFTTNAAGSIVIFAPVGVEPSGKYQQHTVIHVVNTAAADRAIIVGSGNYFTNAVNTVARCTNTTDVYIDIVPNNTLLRTNFFCKPTG